MKEIALVPDKPFHNNVDIAVMDFPEGTESGKKRKRCGITVDFAETDVKQLQKRGMNYEDAIKYYEDYIYKMVRANIAMEWKCVEGWDRVMDIVSEHVKAYY